MFKGILIIDMPENCNGCPLLFRHDEERCCIPEGRNVFTKERPFWCPLYKVEEYDNIVSQLENMR